MTNFQALLASGFVQDSALLAGSGAVLCNLHYLLRVLRIGLDLDDLDLRRGIVRPLTIVSVIVATCAVLSPSAGAGTATVMPSSVI